jgi:hypothetical protein
MAETLSMPDPCDHITRIDVIRARLHGTMDAVINHLATCDHKHGLVL